MKLNWKNFLILGGSISIIIGLLHLVIIFYGAAAYRYFDAGEEMALMAERGSLLPAITTFFIASILIIWGLYAFAGVGLIRRFPFLRSALVVISVIFTLRGIMFFYEIYEVIMLHKLELLKEVLFSSVSLITGLAYLIGIKFGWQVLRKTV